MYKNICFISAFLASSPLFPLQVFSSSSPFDLGVESSMSCVQIIFITVHNCTVQLDNTWRQPGCNFVNKTSPTFSPPLPHPFHHPLENCATLPYMQGPNLKTRWTVSLCGLKIVIISHFNYFELHNIMSMFVFMSFCMLLIF